MIKNSGLEYEGIKKGVKLMSNIILNEKIIISNVEEVVNNLSRILKEEIEFDSVVNYIQNEKNVFYYIDDKLNSNMIVQDNSMYVWVDTGLKYYKKPIFISLLRRGDMFEGYYVGDVKNLAESIKKYNIYNRREIDKNIDRFNKKYIMKHQTDEVEEGIERISSIRYVDSEKTNEKKEVQATIVKTSQENNNIYKEIYSNLLINNWKSEKGLERYIKIIGCRIGQLVARNETAYYIKNNIASVVVNTGLLDKYANEILVLYKFHVTNDCYYADKMIKSKCELLEQGFDREQAKQNIAKIRFMETNDDLRGISMDDFDINSECLKHILEDRRDRFPESVVDCSTELLAMKLKDSLKMGLKILANDSNYAKPSYSAKLKNITWFMPFHVHTGLNEKPELVFAIRLDKNGAFYQVKTVLPYDDEIKDRVTALSLYGNSW